MEESTPAVKKTTRTRKTASSQTIPAQENVQVSITTSTISQTQVTQNFDELVDKIVKSKQEFDNLQKEISQTKQDWAREQKEHEIELTQRNSQEELERKREKETYEYATTLLRKRAEDEFQDKKLAWEKELSQRKEELDKEKQELEQLRKLVADFDNQKEQAVKETQTQTEKELTDQFNQERKLKEQEVKAEKDLLNMRISTLETDNSRLVKDIEILKRSLEEATRQVKEIAVKVIESGSSQNKPQGQANNP